MDKTEHKIEQLMDERQVSAWLNIPLPTLQKMRTAKMIAAGKCSIPFLRISSSIRYQPSAVKAALTEAAIAAMAPPPPKPAPAPKPAPDGQPRRQRGRPMGSPNKSRGA